MTVTTRWEVPLEQWDRTEDQIYTTLAVYASQRRFLTYTELVTHLDWIDEPGSRALADMLGNIQSRCDDEGRPLLPAIVVRKDTFTPGEGFFRMARSLGHTFDDTSAGHDRFWLSQIEAVFTEWSR